MDEIRPTPYNIEHVAEALYEFDRAHSPTRKCQWKMAGTRQQEQYRGRAFAAIEAMQRIGGTG